MANANTELVRRFIDVVQNQYNVDALGDFVAPNYVDHSVNNSPAAGLEAQAWFTMLFAAFPDAQSPVEDIVGEDDLVFTRRVFRGSHKGEFMGVPATNKSVSMQVIDKMRVVDGKITERWAAVDILGMLRELGAAPVRSPAPGGAEQRLATTPQELEELRQALLTAKKATDEYTARFFAPAPEVVLGQKIDFPRVPTPGERREMVRLNAEERAAENAYLGARSNYRP